jgi:lipopolysaccharide transport system ATP-binding protein
MNKQKVVIQVDNLSKYYRLGSVGTGTLAEDLNLWWARVRGKEEEALPIGQEKVSGKKQHWALNDLSFKVNEGEIVGIIGKNGAGKSTLLKILSRVTSPTKGEVKIKGRIASLLEVGTGFHHELTGRENIFLNGAILGMSKKEIRSKLDDIIEFSGVEKYVDTPVKRYSSGMLVRLAFAVAAHLEPEILIVDEVLAVGDAEFQRKCLGKMKDVAGHGRTVLFVSHDMGSIKRLCTRGIFLKNGKMEYDGEVDGAIEKYLAFKLNERVVSKNGLGGIRIQDIQFLDRSGKKVDSFYTFDEIAVECTYVSDVEKDDVSFAICFNNMHETRVTSLWTSFFDTKFDIRKGVFKVIFKLPSVHMISGEYEVISYIDWKGQEVERVDNFRRVTIGFTKSFGYVIEPKSNHGLYVEKFTAELLV